MVSASSLSMYSLVILLLFAAGAIPATQISTATEKNTTTNTPSANQATPQSGSSIQFGDQQSDGKAVTVKSATLPEGGFIVIHEAISKTATSSSSSSSLSPPTSEATMGRRSPMTTASRPRSPEQLSPEPVEVDSIVGVSEYLDPGTHRNVTVSLFDVPGKEFERSQLTESQDVASAELHRDTNSNNRFDFLTSDRTTDKPYYVPYLLSGDRVIQKGPIIDTAVIAIGENMREAQGLGPTPLPTTVFGGAEAAAGSNGSAPVQTQANIGAPTDSTPNERTEGSGSGFGIVIAVVAIVSGFILTQRV